jgi:hypothetical protein
MVGLRWHLAAAAYLCLHVPVPVKPSSNPTGLEPHCWCFLQQSVWLICYWYGKAHLCVFQAVTRNQIGSGCMGCQSCFVPGGSDLCCMLQAFGQLWSSSASCKGRPQPVAGCLPPELDCVHPLGLSCAHRPASPYEVQ